MKRALEGIFYFQKTFRLSMAVFSLRIDNSGTQNVIIYHCDLKLQLLSSVRFKMCYVLKNQTSLFIYLKWLTLKCLVIGNLFQNVIREIRYLSETSTIQGVLTLFPISTKRNSQLKPVDSLHQELIQCPLQSKSHSSSNPFHNTLLCDN